MAIRTIGDIAQADPWLLNHLLGKWGGVLQTFARGEDAVPVARYDDLMVIKSIGNSTTAVRDLRTMEDAKMIVWVLAESVAARMREQGFVGRTVRVSLRDDRLASCTRQAVMERPTDLAAEITAAAVGILAEEWRERRPLRTMGVSVTDFSHNNIPVQLDLFTDQPHRERLGRMEAAVDDLRRRFGPYAVRRAVLLQDQALTGFSPKEDHVIHPYSYF